jgi:hypothetical protein
MRMRNRPIVLFCGPLIGNGGRDHTAVAMLYNHHIHRAKRFSLHNF